MKQFIYIDSGLELESNNWYVLESDTSSIEVRKIAKAKAILINHMLSFLVGNGTNKFFVIQ